MSALMLAIEAGCFCYIVRPGRGLTRSVQSCARHGGFAFRRAANCNKYVVIWEFCHNSPRQMSLVLCHHNVVSVYCVIQHEALMAKMVAWEPSQWCHSLLDG